MNPESQSDVKSIFGQALELTDPSQRMSYLDQACSNAPEVRSEVEELLVMHERAGSFMRQPAVLGFNVTGNKESFAEQPDTFLGPYKLLQQIGEGGMGKVFMAEQTAPVHRKVALKIIKPGMDSKQVVARFEAELQVLAMMDHINIARVLDAGTSDQGRPYFVMELVYGVPLLQYCDTHKLTLRERLELFVPICQAIQHAHQKGIIHRDLKPSNVLVTMYDDKPVPKVIDFGVAKAIERKLTEKTLFTQYGTLVGTFEYMSPEQAEMNAFGVDTRSDVYSLGVLLYELLTGTTPLQHKQLRDVGLREIVRLIQAEEPPQPSERLSTAETLVEMAAARRTEPSKLSLMVQGELDWIAMRCLEKDRTRRYDGAGSLAKDIQRYLADELVEARPPSAGYRLTKFVRRHKGEVIAAGLVLVALLMGIVGTTLGLIWAQHQRRLAESARIEAEALQARAEAGEKLAEAEKEKAEKEKRIAQAVRDFLQNKLLGQADVTVQADALLKAGRSVSEVKENPTIRELLDRADDELTEAKIEGNFPNQPILQAEILFTVGSTYHGIGDYSHAIELLERSLALRKATLSENHLDTLVTRNKLVAACLRADKRNKAQKLAKETLDLTKTTLGPDHPETLSSMRNLAHAYRRLDKLELAVPLFKETLERRQKTLGLDHPKTLTSMRNLANGYIRTGKEEQALDLYEKARDLTERTLGSGHPSTLTSMRTLAWAYERVGKDSLALPLAKKTLELTRKTLGPNHFDTLSSTRRLAWIYRKTGQQELGLPLLETLSCARPKETALTLKVAALQMWSGLDEQYTATAERALQVAAGTEDPVMAERMAKVCCLSPTADRDRLAATLNLTRIAVVKGKNHKSLAHFQMALGMAEYRNGNFNAAEQALLAAVKGIEQNRHIVGTSGFYRAMSLFRQGKQDEARQLATSTALRMKPLPKDAKNPLAGKASVEDLILWMAYKEAKSLIGFKTVPRP